MASTTALLLLVIAALGVALVAVQIGFAMAHLRHAESMPKAFPPISILKPLCGVDDALLSNLQSFAHLRYPNYEVLLGVKDDGDAAYPIACQAALLWPDHMRVVVQRGAPGLNPKVNQLITLAQRARHDLLVISDSNVTVDERYLGEIAALLEDDRIGVVTHPIAGLGEDSWGALFDNLHLCASVGPGMIAANRLGGTLVVGKSMAFRRADLYAIGGFEAIKDVLAEDFVMGRMITRMCAKQVAVAHRPIMNVSCRRSLRDFLERYTRWSIMQRSMVGRGLYTAQLVLNPVPFALGALLFEPTRHTLALVVLCGVTKTALECIATRAVRRGGSSRLALLAVPLKDLLLLGAWTAGLLKTEVRWRGHRLLVLEGSRLAPSPAAGQWQAQASS